MDSSHSTINMLVNSDVEWYMTDNGVPQGSGDISGVIVSTTTSYHDANLLGKYQIRPLELSDIVLGDTGFSEKLVEWFSVDTPKATLSGNIFSATLGDGKMEGVNPNQTTSYLNFTGKNENAKAFRYDGVWWDTATGKAGDTVKWTFSTSSCSGKKLVFVFNAVLGKLTEDKYGQAPVNWNVEYSLNGTDYVLIKKIFIRPLPKKSTDLTVLPSAADEYCIELPLEVSGQENVTIRLSASDDTTIDFATGEYTAKVTFKPDTKNKGQYIRFGAVAIKYNK